MRIPFRDNVMLACSYPIDVDASYGNSSDQTWDMAHGPSHIDNQSYAVIRMYTKRGPLGSWPLHTACVTAGIGVYWG